MEKSSNSRRGAPKAPKKEQGGGAAASTSVRYPAELLDRMRQVGDPEADRAVAAVFATSSVEQVNAMMRHMDENEDLVPEALPPVVRDYLTRTAALPPWADATKLAVGEDLFGRHAPQIVLALHCAALPMCYSAKKGVQVLARTRRLQDYTYRRIMETAQFLMDVMDEGAFAPSGRGVRSSQKIRLLHATIRFHLSRDKSWDPSYGLPINQEDMAGTLTSFSACVVRSLEQLQIVLTPDEREAYAHIWSVVGHLLGIDAAMLPRSYDEHAALMDLIVQRHTSACPEGQAMTRALIDYMKYMAPGNILDGLPAVFIRHLCGDPMAEVLGVEPADWTRALVTPFRVLMRLSDEATGQSAMLAGMAEVLGRRTLEALAYVMRGGKRYEVRIPRSARERWGL